MGLTCRDCTVLQILNCTYQLFEELRLKYYTLLYIFIIYFIIYSVIIPMRIQCLFRDCLTTVLIWLHLAVHDAGNLTIALSESRMPKLELEKHYSERFCRFSR